MKKLFLVLTALYLMSCTHTIKDNGVVTAVKVAADERVHAKYIVTVANIDEWSVTKEIEFETNHLYSVGDTVQFTKKR